MDTLLNTQSSFELLSNALYLASVRCLTGLPIDIIFCSEITLRAPLFKMKYWLSAVAGSQEGETCKLSSYNPTALYSSTIFLNKLRNSYSDQLVRLLVCFFFPKHVLAKKVSEYDQEIPQLQTADKHMAPRERAT